MEGSGWRRAASEAWARELLDWKLIDIEIESRVLSVTRAATRLVLGQRIQSLRCGLEFFKITGGESVVQWLRIEIE